MLAPAFVAAALLSLTSASPEKPSLLGPIVHARGPLHLLNRTELLEELQQHGVAHKADDTDRQLVLRLQHAREALLTRRNAIVMQAERVMQEVFEQSGSTFISDVSLDTLLSDGNAILATAAGNRITGELQWQTGIGAVLGLFLFRYAPLGRLPAGTARLSLSGYATVVARGSVLLGVLQLAKEQARRLLSAPSAFCEKLAAVACREGLLDYVAEVEADGASSPSAPPSGNGAAAPGSPRRPSLLLRRAVAVPILLLATGSSVFEEVAFRGVLLHGLATCARLPPPAAAAISSALFGLAHVGNEASLLHKSVYAAWTFVGGLIFGGAYLRTGGCVAPMLLHFGLNGIIFSHAATKVAAKLLADRRAMADVARRVAAEAAAEQRESRAIEAAIAAAEVATAARTKAAREEGSTLRERPSGGRFLGRFPPVRTVDIGSAGAAPR